MTQLQTTFHPKIDIGSGDAQGRHMQGHGCLCGNFKRDSAGAPHSIPEEMCSEISLWLLSGQEASSN